MNTEQLIAQSVSEVPPSGIRKFFDIASDMKNVISMSVGEPDFVTPWNVCQAAIDSIERGETHYTSNSGMPELRALIEEKLAERERALKEREKEARLQKEAIDVTLPVEPRTSGAMHPCSIVLDQLLTIFTGMGFEVVEGPEVE